jgi:hypothetical protein
MGPAVQWSPHGSGWGGVYLLLSALSVKTVAFALGRLLEDSRFAARAAEVRGLL